MTEIAIIQGICELKYGSSKSIQILSKFLLYDIGMRKSTSILEWINNDNYNSIVLNYSFIVKNNNKIKIYFFYDGYDREENEKRDKFETNKETFIRIVTEWEEIYKKLTPMLIITKEGNDIKLDPKRFDDKK